MIITSQHFNSNYIAVGDMQGIVRLYNYEEHILMASRSVSALPNFRPILEEQVTNKKIVYITCSQICESSKAVTALKFSLKCTY